MMKGDFPTPAPYVFRRIPSKTNYLKRDEESKEYHLFLEFFQSGDKYKGITEMVKCHSEWREDVIHYLPLSEFDKNDFHSYRERLGE